RSTATAWQQRICDAWRNSFYGTLLVTGRCPKTFPVLLHAVLRLHLIRGRPLRPGDIRWARLEDFGDATGSRSRRRASTGRFVNNVVNAFLAVLQGRSQ